MYDVIVFILLLNDDPFYVTQKASVRFPYWLVSHFPALHFLFVPHFHVSHFQSPPIDVLFSQFWLIDWSKSTQTVPHWKLTKTYHYSIHTLHTACRTALRLELLNAVVQLPPASLTCIAISSDFRCVRRSHTILLYITANRTRNIGAPAYLMPVINTHWISLTVYSAILMYLSRLLY